MFDVVKKLIFARQLKMEEGKIELLRQPVVISPISAFVIQQKELEKALGPKKAASTIYNGIKMGSIEYNKEIRDFFKMKGRELTDWQCNSVTLSGWGLVKVLRFNPQLRESVIVVEDSTFAKSYGKSNHPVDNIIAGFAAAKMIVEFGEDMECVETKCISKGDRICEFVSGPREKIEKIRKRIWSNIK
ncbi:MAG: V4R domain-containing protein [Candidatus Hodarchaeales archaeon]|jgi:predicted hydrocarbon binding protein